MAKGNPIPTKFEQDEEQALKLVAKKSGMPVSEVVRRAVILLNEEVKLRGGKVGWIVDELGDETKSVLLPREVFSLALQRAKAKGFSSFSEYIAKLVMDDQDSSPGLRGDT